MKTFLFFFLLAISLRLGAVSLVELFAIDSSILNQDELSQQQCQSFRAINMEFDCLQLRQKLHSLARAQNRSKPKPEKIEGIKKELAALRHQIEQKLAYLEQNFLSASPEPFCLDCSLVDQVLQGEFDAVEQFKKGLFCEDEGDYAFDKKEYCGCVEKRATILTPPVQPSAGDHLEFEKQWASNLGNRIFGGISSTIYQIGGAIAENRILGMEFEASRLPACDVTKIRSFLEQVTTKGCPNGKPASEVHKRLQLLFPERFSDIDSFAAEFEDLAVMTATSGIPPQADPEGECHLPWQMYQQYAQVLSLGPIENIYHSLELLLKVIPENMVAGIYQSDTPRPFDKLLEFALQKVESGEIVLPPDVALKDWNTAVVGGLAMLLQTGQGAKISYTLQSFSGLQNFIEGAGQLKESFGPPRWSGGARIGSSVALNRDLLAFLSSDKMTTPLNQQLNRHCQNVFDKVLPQALCEPLAPPNDVTFRQQLKSERFLQMDALFCRKPGDQISDLFGFGSLYFADPDRSVEEDLDALFNVGMGLPFTEFNQLCPLLKSCQGDLCFFNKASSISPEQISTLSPQLQQSLQKLVQAEELYQGLRGGRSRGEEKSEGFDDIFAEEEGGAKTAVISSKQNIKDSMPQDMIEAIWEFDQKRAEELEEQNHDTELKVSEKQQKDYESNFVNQFAYGKSMTPAVPLTSKKLKEVAVEPAVKVAEGTTKEFSQEQGLNKVFEKLQHTYHRLQDREIRMQEFEQQNREQAQVTSLAQERALIASERAGIARERQYLREISQLQDEKMDLMRQRVADQQRFLQKERQWHQALESDGPVQELPEPAPTQSLQRAEKEESQQLSPREKTVSKKIGKDHFPDFSAAVKTQLASPSPSTVSRASSSSGFNGVTGGHQLELPQIEANDYLSFERTQKILAHGVTKEAPHFMLLTNDIAGELLQIPMVAQFNDKGEIVALVPELSSEHQSLIASIGDKLVREDLLMAIKGQSQLPLLEVADFLNLSEQEIATRLGDQQQFNLLTKGSQEMDLLIPFKVVRKGQENVGIVLNLVASNYHWVRHSLEALEDKRVLERIYQQLAREDQSSRSGK